MLRLARSVIVLLPPALAFSQFTADSVTVTATQPANLQLDQSIFSVTVTSGLGKNLDDIVAALQGAGITAADFVGINTSPSIPVNPAQPPNAEPQLRWDFQLVVAVSKLKDTTSALSALAPKISQNDSGLSLSFSVVGTEVSSQQASPCNLSDLISNARAQAQQLTSAAGLTLGMIQAITTSSPTSCLITARFAIGTQLIPSQPNSITVTASRPLAVQPDQISITLGVTSDINSGVDDIITALQQAGISGVAFAGVYTTAIYAPPVGQAPPAPQSRLQWSFTLSAPLSKIKDTLAAIVAGQQSLAKATPALMLTIFGARTQISADLANAQTCPESDLVKDAQAQAQKVAAAAGVSAGAILGINGGGVPLALAPAVRLGDFVSSAGFASFTSSALGLAPACSRTVTFQLLQ